MRRELAKTAVPPPTSRFENPRSIARFPLFMFINFGLWAYSSVG